MTLEDIPFGCRQRPVPAKFTDMLLTSLNAIPRPPIPPGCHGAAASFIPSSTPNISSLSTATVQDALDDGTDDPRLPPPTPAPTLASQPTHSPIDTPPNRFGVFRHYSTAPRSDPEDRLTLNAFDNASTRRCTPPDPVNVTHSGCLGPPPVCDSPMLEVLLLIPSCRYSTRRHRARAERAVYRR